MTLLSVQSKKCTRRESGGWDSRREGGKGGEQDGSVKNKEWKGGQENALDLN